MTTYLSKNYRMTPKFRKVLLGSVTIRIALIIVMASVLSFAYITRTIPNGGVLRFLDVNPLFWAIPIFYATELIFGICRFSVFLTASVATQNKHKVHFAAAAILAIIGILALLTNKSDLIAIISAVLIMVGSVIVPVLFVINLALDILALRRIS